MLSVECSGCKVKFRVDEKYAGRSAKCPKCGGALDVPIPLKGDTDARQTAKAIVADDASRHETIATATEKEFRPNQLWSYLFAPRLFWERPILSVLLLIVVIPIAKMVGGWAGHAAARRDVAATERNSMRTSKSEGELARTSTIEKDSPGGTIDQSSSTVRSPSLSSANSLQDALPDALNSSLWKQRPAPLVGPVSNEDVKAMGHAFSFAFAFQEGLRRFFDEPSLRGQAGNSLMRFRSEFAPALEELDGILRREIGSDWDATVREMEEAIKHMPGEVDKNLALKTLEASQDDFKNVWPKPYLATTLRFDPSVRAEPSSEMRRGYYERFRSDGSGKANGLKLGIDYPLSWKATDGRMPHVLQRFSGGSHGMASVTISVQPLPNDAAAEIEGIGARSWFDAFNDDDLQEMFAPAGYQIIKKGKTRIANRDSVWLEATFSQSRLGTEVVAYGCMFYILEAGNFVIVQCTCAGSNPVNPGSPEETFARFGPLFLSMLNTLSFAG